MNCYFCKDELFCESYKGATWTFFCPRCDISQHTDFKNNVTSISVTYRNFRAVFDIISQSAYLETVVSENISSKTWSIVSNLNYNLINSNINNIHHKIQQYIPFI